MLIINGKEFEYEKDRTLAMLLEKLGYDMTKVAVERNREIVPKAEYHHTVLEDGDTLEVVRFVGGG